MRIACLFLAWLPAASSFAGFSPVGRTAKNLMRMSAEDTTVTANGDADVSAVEEEKVEVPTAPSTPTSEDADFSLKVQSLFQAAPKPTQYDVMIKLIFPGALSNEQLLSRVNKELFKKGYTPENTLLATSLCCDELARQLEGDFVKVYGKNFNLGGLSGFPFAGNTGFGAMSAHIPGLFKCLHEK